VVAAVVFFFFFFFFHLCLLLVLSNSSGNLHSSVCGNAKMNVDGWVQGFFFFFKLIEWVLISWLDWKYF
jgi:hypothetical protein